MVIAIVEPKEVAVAFARELRKELTTVDFREVIRRNKTPEYASLCCASHDFCDANMVMHAAFERLGLKTYVDMEPNDDGTETPEQLAAMDLWNAAWDIAKVSNFKII